MTMDEVNERFPLTKYKAWRSNRENQGLSTAGGISSRPASIKAVETGIQPSEPVSTPTPTTAPAPAEESAEASKAPTLPPLFVHQQDTVTSSSGAAPSGAQTSTFGSDAPWARSSLNEKQPDPDKAKIETGASQDSPPGRPSATDTDDDDDDDDPIRTAAPPELLASPGDTCAICLDTLDEDDDVRGLTCGHAFHAGCVDPWLTSRRACCPLCKADYYVPKPRPEGDVTSETPGRRQAGLRLNLPASPPMVWSPRNGSSLFRPRAPSGPDNAAGSPDGRSQPHTPVFSPARRHSSFMAVLQQSDRPRRPSQEAPQVSTQDTAQQPQSDSSRQSQVRNWASGLRSINLFRRGRRDEAATNPAPSPIPTPAQLEEGTAAR